MKRKSGHAKVFNMVLFAIFAAITLLMSLIPQIGFITAGPVAITLVHIPVLIGIMVLPLWYSLGLGFTFGLGSLIAAFAFGKTPMDMAFQNPLISILPRVLFALVAFFILKGLMALEKVKGGRPIILVIVSVITMAFMVAGAFAIDNLIASTKEVPADHIYESLKYMLPIMIVIGLIFIGFYILFARKEKTKKNVAIPSSIMVSTLLHTVLVLSILYLFKPGIAGVDLNTLLSIVIGGNGFIEILAAVAIGTPIAIAIRTAFPALSDGKAPKAKSQKGGRVEVAGARDIYSLAETQEEKEPSNEEVSAEENN